MGTFLDMRSSMNANATGVISTALSTAPQLFGIIGLQTRNVANPIVTLAGTVGLSGGTGGGTFSIQVVRGVTGGTTIYTATATVPVDGTQGLFSFNAQDLLAPAAAETVYTAFVSGNAAAVTTLRNGPETFYGIASNSATV